MNGEALEAMDRWPASHSAAVVVAAPDGTATVVAGRGDVERPFPLASVTKLLTATAVLVAIEEEAIGLDQPGGPDGSTVRHLLAHASGLGIEGEVVAPPGRRRIYSNAGFDEVADLVVAATEIPFGNYLAEGVLRPLGMDATSLDGSPARDGVSTARDLAALAGEVLVPTLLAPATLHLATSVAFPGLTGVLPGFGRQSPNDWGLGFEIRDSKSPHWTAPTNSPSTVGHFGQTGTFLWVDPRARLALVCLTDLAFGPWAMSAWPALGEAVLATFT